VNLAVENSYFELAKQIMTTVTGIKIYGSLIEKNTVLGIAVENDDA
jgi:hypothetical protein